MCGNPTTYKEDNEVAKTINERFNVDITTLLVNGFDNDKMNVTLASGDIPDVFIRWGTQGYYDDGIIQAITKDMVAKYMPETYKAANSYGDAAWLLNTSSSDGAIMGIPQIAVAGDAVIAMAVRQDWLDKVGAAVPTSIDELTEVMRKFTLEDPDGNGKNDTYGMSAPGMHTNPLFACFPNVFGAFGVIPNVWNLDENGEVSYGAVQSGYKAALKLLNSWYEEGLLDKEWITTDNATFSTKLQTGLAGFYDCVHPGYLDPNTATGLITLTKANTPTASWTFMAPPTGPEGKAGGGTYGAVGTWTMMFGAKASIEQVARGMQIAEAINTDQSLFELTYSGIEGVTFEKKDGVNVFLSGVTAQEFGANVFRTASIINWENTALVTSKAVLDMDKQSLEFPVIRNVVNASAIDGIAGADNVDTAEMTKIVNEFFFNAITGTVDIDAEWDAYVEKWNKLGGEAETTAARSMPILYE